MLAIIFEDGWRCCYNVVRGKNSIIEKNCLVQIYSFPAFIDFFLPFFLALALDIKKGLGDLSTLSLKITFSRKLQGATSAIDSPINQNVLY